MHLTLKREATKPAAANFLQQQARFDKFSEVFNHERPHEALDMKCPAEVYLPSPRPTPDCRISTIPSTTELSWSPVADAFVWAERKSTSARVFAGQAVGIQEVHDDIWLVSFMQYYLGYFDLETRVLEPLASPFGAKVLPMS
jgi:putative transposase